jgi:hypothetical protein
VMFTVEGLPVDVPVRLATMDAYDGLVWQVSAGDAEEPSLDNSGAFERVGASIPPEYDGDLADVVIQRRLDSNGRRSDQLAVRWERRRTRPGPPAC